MKGHRKKIAGTLNELVDIALAAAAAAAGGAPGEEKVEGGGVLARAGGAPAGVAVAAIKYLITMDNLTIGDKELGKGAFGLVTVGTYNAKSATGEVMQWPVAIKKVNAKYLKDAKAMEAIVAENDRLAECHSPFVTKCFGTAQDIIDLSLAIVMELCDLGDLKDHTFNGHYGVLKGSRMCPFLTLSLSSSRSICFLGSPTSTARTWCTVILRRATSC